MGRLSKLRASGDRQQPGGRGSFPPGLQVRAPRAPRAPLSCSPEGPALPWMGPAGLRLPPSPPFPWRCSGVPQAPSHGRTSKWGGRLPGSGSGPARPAAGRPAGLAWRRGARTAALRGERGRLRVEPPGHLRGEPAAVSPPWDQGSPHPHPHRRGTRGHAERRRRGWGKGSPPGRGPAHPTGAPRAARAHRQLRREGRGRVDTRTLGRRGAPESSLCCWPAARAVY